MRLVYGQASVKGSRLTCHVAASRQPARHSLSARSISSRRALQQPSAQLATAVSRLVVHANQEINSRLRPRSNAAQTRSRRAAQTCLQQLAPAVLACKWTGFVLLVVHETASRSRGSRRSFNSAHSASAHQLISVQAGRARAQLPALYPRHPPNTPDHVRCSRRVQYASCALPHVALGPGDPACLLS